MPVFVRTALAPLVLVLLLAVQGIAAPEASAGRTAKIARPTTSRASAAKSTAARFRAKPATRTRLSTRPTSRLVRPGRPALSSKTLSSKTLSSKTLSSKTLSSKTLSSKHSSSRVAKGQQGSLARTSAAKSKLRPTSASLRSKVARTQSLETANATAKPGRWKATQKFVQAAVAKFKAHPGVVRVIKTYTNVAASITRRLDGLQARAPPFLAKTMDVLRTYTLPSIAAYTFSRVKNDRAFLGSYLASSSVVSNIILPGAIALGMDPVLSGVLNALTTPLTLGVIVLRERHNRRKAGEEISIADTTKLITKEYRDFAKERRVASSAAAQVQ